MNYQVSVRAKTWYLPMWKYHRCYGFIINRAFHTRKLLKWDGSVVIGVYIINRTLHGLLEIRNFASRVEKIFHSFAALTLEIFLNTRRKLRISARPCNILYVFFWFSVSSKDIVDFHCTVIRSVLEYCSPIFHHSLLDCLSERVQKRALSIIAPDKSRKPTQCDCLFLSSSCSEAQIKFSVCVCLICILNAFAFNCSVG